MFNLSSNGDVISYMTLSINLKTGESKWYYDEAAHMADKAYIKGVYNTIQSTGNIPMLTTVLDGMPSNLQNKMG